MNNTEAFWLPPGSIRAFLAIMLVGALIVASLIPEVPREALTTLGPLAGMAVQAYFNKEKAAGDPAGGGSTVNVSQPTGGQASVNVSPTTEETNK